MSRAVEPPPPRRSSSPARSALVTSQHKARKLFVELEREQARARAARRGVGPAAARAEHLGPARARRALAAARAAACALPDPRARAHGRASTPARDEVQPRAPVLALRLPVWRSRVVLAARSARGFAVLVGRAFYLQACNDRLPAGKGRGALQPRARDAGNARARSWTATARRSPSRRRWNRSGRSPRTSRRRTRSSCGRSPRCSACRRDEIDQPPRRRGARLRLPEAPDRARAVADEVVALQHPGRLPAARVPPLLPGRRGDGARGRLHRRRRRRPGGHRARATRARSRGKPGSRRVIKDRLGRIVEDVESIRARAGRQGPHAVDRLAPAVPRLRRSSRRRSRRTAPRRGGDRRARREHRRSARAREPADLQPEQPRAARPARSCATARSPTCSSRARRSSPSPSALALETGKVTPQHDDPDRARLAHHRQLRPSATRTRTARSPWRR